MNEKAIPECMHVIITVAVVAMIMPPMSVQGYTPFLLSVNSVPTTNPIANIIAITDADVGKPVVFIFTIPSRNSSSAEDNPITDINFLIIILVISLSNVI